MRANVFIQTAFLGDLLLSIPLIKKMKSLWPDRKLILVCRRGVGDFFLKTGLVDEILEVIKSDAGSYESALRALNQQQIDTVISAHGSLRTAFFVRSLKAKQKIGFRTWWNAFFYDVRVSKNSTLPDAMRQLSLLQPFDETLAENLKSYASEGNPYFKNAEGALPAPPAWASMNLRDYYANQNEQVQQLGDKLGFTPEEATRAVALFPGSVWATKRWTQDGFVGVGQELARQGIPVFVMGGPGEEKLCAEVAAGIPGAKDLCGKTSILESALLLSRIAAVVGNDSASLHLAATSGTPSVAVFGPTVLEFGFRPWQENVFIEELEGLPCRPCGKHGHQVCPIGTHECMKRLSKDTVGAKLQSALRRRHHSSV